MTLKDFKKLFVWFYYCNVHVAYFTATTLVLRHVQGIALGVRLPNHVTEYKSSISKGYTVGGHYLVAIAISTARCLGNFSLPLAPFV
jgi:hypothetical protein